MSGAGGLRRCMAWLHGWLGLLAGWILFAMFLTGTASYVRPEITRWMRPEIRTTAPPAADAAGIVARRLATTAAGADRWTIFLPQPRDPLAKVFVRAPGAATRPVRQELDPATGMAVRGRETHGGELLYDFHYTLHLPKPWGEWIAGLCAFAMLAAIVSGVITHKRIFTDFFTMRWNRGQRSWLDAHNLVAVLGLPYHLAITYTGLITLATLYMPWPVRANYATPAGYAAEAFSEDVAAQRTGRPAPLVPLAPLVRDAERRWGGVPASSVAIRFPGDAGAVVSIAARTGAGLAARGGSLSYAGTTGRLLGGSRPAAAGIATGAALFGLHLGYFAGPALRWLLVLLGLAGTAMIGSGLVLWRVKRMAGGGIGHRLVDRLNIAAIACFPGGIAAYFLANRLIPAALPGRAAGEAWMLFAGFAIPALASCALPVRRAWIATLGLAAALYALVPLADVLSVGMPRDGLFLGFDLAMLGAAAALGFAGWRVRRPIAPRLRVRPIAGAAHVVA